MIITVASGKGGTGKTTVAVSFALSLLKNKITNNKQIQLIDCDVEEPNAHFFMELEYIHREQTTIPSPTFNSSLCNFCGECQKICEFNAIAVVNNQVLFFPELCHGCGACKLFCPQNSINEVERVIGVIEFGKIKKDNNFQFIHGRLNIGEPRSSPLIKALKKKIDKSAIVIIDAPPGTSCSVIESIKGSNYCILVTEPTPFGLNDLILAVESVKKLKINFGVLINKDGIGNDEVEKYCKKEKIPIIMKIPFDKTIAENYSKGIILIDSALEYRKKFFKLYKEINISKK